MSGIGLHGARTLAHGGTVGRLAAGAGSPGSAGPADRDEALSATLLAGRLLLPIGAAILVLLTPEA